MTVAMPRTRKKVEQPDPEILAIVAQIERLDYVYDLMEPVWREIEASLRKSQR